MEKLNHLLKLLEVTIEVEVIEDLADKWNVSSLELVDITNEVSNEHPATIEFLLKTLLKFTEVALEKGISLKESLGLIVELKYVCSLFDENHEYDEDATIKVTANSIKNIINKGGNIQGIKDAKSEDFGIYMLHTALYLKDRMADDNSSFNKIA